MSTKNLNGVDECVSALGMHIRQIEKRAVSGMEQVAEALANWAKVEHSYTDRTTNLTNSIRGYVAEVTPQLITAVLTASMDYAIFVELARDQKYAFLQPVVEKHLDDIRAVIESALEG